jgi:hypothetical protein
MNTPDAIIREGRGCVPGYLWVGLLYIRVRGLVDKTQESKYIECWLSTTSAWAGWIVFDILVRVCGGVHSLLLCTSYTLNLLTVSTLANREIPIEQNIKS